MFGSCHFWLLLLFLAVSVESCDRKEEPEILWDKYGVPHIYAGSNEEMYYAFGRAQMNSHANLMLRLYGQARGKASEYWGKDYLESDKKILLFDLTSLADSAYLSQGTYKSCLDSFVKGINDFAEENPESIGEDFRQVLPVTPQDVLSHMLRVICLEFLAPEDIYTVKNLTQAGSNSCAIGPSVSASGKSMLLTNPHLPWSDFFTWFEAHLNAKGFSTYGIALVGMPSITIAFNNFLGWTHTVNTIDASDRYELKLEGDGYILDKEILTFTTRNVVIKVKQPDGSILEDTSEFKYSVHGPVAGQKEGVAYAIRIAGLRNYRMLEQYHKMSASRNLEEFETAVRMLQNPMFNIVYADNKGNIMYLFNGNIPVRQEGDFAFWKSTIDGSLSKNIWTKTHPYEDLPRVLNPESGFVQNCNDPPWTCTYPLKLKNTDYPPYFSPMGMPLRPQRAVNLIKGRKGITFDQFVEYKLNTGMEVADRFLDDLLDAVKTYPESEAMQAAEVLKNWDRKTEVSSKGAVLFAEWYDKMRYAMFEKQWSIDEPVSTPSGFIDPSQAVRMLAEAAVSVKSKYGSLSVPWGDVYRFRIGSLDFPANGGPDSYGIFRTFHFTPVTDNKKVVIAGDTYVAVTEFGDKVRAKVLLSYGNASQPGNSHVGDQLEMLSRKELRSALLEKSEILGNLERKETLQISP